MASTYPALTVLLPPDQVPVRIDSIDQAYELLNLGTAFGPTISTSNRHGEFGEFIRRRCEDELGLRGLEFLYCRPWESADGACALLMQDDHLPPVIDALSMMLDWFRVNPSEHTDPKTVLAQLSAAPTFDPSLDDGHWIDYLLSLRAFARRARDEGLGMLYVQWDGG